VELPIALGPPVADGVDVVGFGLNTIDLIAVVGQYPAPDTKQPLADFVERPGGQAATSMTACARLGWRARYVGRFGNDARGRLAREALERDGVDLSACEVVAAPQPISLILVDETGRRTVMWSRAPGLNLAAADVNPHVVTSGRVLLVDCHQTAAATRAAACARRAGLPTMIDVEAVRPGIEDLLSEVDLIVTARSFPEAFTGVSGIGSALEAMAQRFKAALVCTTLGAEGSLAIVGGREIQTPGFRVPVVDTTGAGDVFRGGFIAGWLLAGGSRPQAEDILTYANAVAALKCGALGARTAIPDRPQVQHLLAETGRGM
jgi:sulfofructose kinase|tara:strand:+ start:9453 stop:10409 length:957 start_codon:yes stop_codon:yes gene_type:complete